MNYVGIDIGMKTCVVAIMDQDKNILEETKYQNTLDSATKFVKRINMLKNKTEYDGKDNALCARKLKKMVSQ